MQSEFMNSINSAVHGIVKTHAKREGTLAMNEQEREEIQSCREQLESRKIALAEKQAALNEEMQLLGKLREDIAAASGASIRRRPCWSCCQHSDKDAGSDDAPEAWRQPRGEDDQL